MHLAKFWEIKRHKKNFKDTGLYTIVTPSTSPHGSRSDKHNGKWKLIIIIHHPPMVQVGKIIYFL
jgi:hypothetical protein